MNNPPEKKKILVCQHGARRRYAIPDMLEEEGMLAALFTDATSFSVLGRVAVKFGKYATPAMQRLAARKPEKVPHKKIYCTDGLFYQSLYRKLIRKPYTEYEQWCSPLSSKMIKWIDKIDRVDIIYNMFCENIAFIRYIKKNHPHIKVVSDIYVHPRTKHIVSSEAENLEIATYQQKGIQNIDIKFITEICELSDTILCPSHFVADGVANLNSTFSQKIAICHYGSSIRYSEEMNTPLHGRIFWAGGDWLRKGLHIYAAAADHLKQKDAEFDFRVAGIVDRSIIINPRFSNLNFLGKLNYQEMKNEFLSADCFVLPTLSEGMAGVVIEALAAGCPVITTRAAGIDEITNGKEGYIVDEGNSEQIIKCIEAIFLTRQQGDKLSKNAKNLAKRYSKSLWKERLVTILNDL